MLAVNALPDHLKPRREKVFGFARGFAHDQGILMFLENSNGSTIDWGGGSDTRLCICGSQRPRRILAMTGKPLLRPVESLARAAMVMWLPVSGEPRRCHPCESSV